MPGGSGGRSHSSPRRCSPDRLGPRAPQHTQTRCATSPLHPQLVVAYSAAAGTGISRHRPSSVGTGIPSTRCPHDSTVLRRCQGCQPYHLSSSLGIESTGISRPHRGHGRFGRGWPRSSSKRRRTGARGAPTRLPAGVAQGDLLRGPAVGAGPAEARQGLSALRSLCAVITTTMYALISTRRQWEKLALPEVREKATPNFLEGCKSLPPETAQVSDLRSPAAIAARLQLPPDHHRVPYPLGQEPVDHRPVRIQHAPAPAPPGRRRAPAQHRPAHRLRVHPSCSAMSQR
jgi:hypothetical protein